MRAGSGNKKGKGIVKAGSRNEKRKGIIIACSGRPLSSASQKKMGFLMPPHHLTNFEIQKYYKNELRFNGFF